MTRFQPQGEVPELKKKTQIFKVEICSLFPFERFSSFSKMRRIMAYILRFRQNTRSSLKNVGPLSAKELNEAENTLVKLAQYVIFL